MSEQDLLKGAYKMKKVKGYCEQKKAVTAKQKDIPKNVGLYKVQVMVPVTVLAYGSPDEFNKNTFLKDELNDAISEARDTFTSDNMKCTKLTKVSQINSDKDLQLVTEWPTITENGAEKLYKLIMEAPKDDKVRNELVKNLCLDEGGDPTDVLDACGGIQVEKILYFEKIC
jgi:hypothetical protein